MLSKLNIEENPLPYAWPNIIKPGIYNRAYINLKLVYIYPSITKATNFARNFVSKWMRWYNTVWIIKPLLSYREKNINFFDVTNDKELCIESLQTINKDDMGFYWDDLNGKKKKQTEPKRIEYRYNRIVKKT